MVTIATLTQKDDGTFEGQLTTLSITMQIALVKDGRKVKDNERDSRIVSRKNGFELGGGWYRTSRSTGEAGRLALTPARPGTPTWAFSCRSPLARKPAAPPSLS